MHSTLLTYFKKRWHEAASANNLFLTSYIDPAKSAKILDIGVDSGAMILERVKAIRRPEIYGIDINNEALKKARKLGIKTKSASIAKGLPYKSNFFDIVSANQIIEHVTDVDLFMKEVVRVLKPGGHLVIATENLSSWHNIFALILGWQGFSQHISMLKNIGNPLRIALMEGYESYGRHFILFTPRGLRELVELYGLKIEDSFGAGYYPFPEPISGLLSKLDPKHTPFIGLKATK